ncbi:MAG: DUF1850 domain-containing protein [Desulfurococcales archaeon]|nr:DUF1850 domain-containing protein [Desulfurococcales archaeon]MCE4622631.1 DUF1850 domain-containing protein [Desulfurococcales archaeon]MCE4629320.1 DUF1850 domain-containing protein [Desulfurococcales archaeon]
MKSKNIIFLIIIILIGFSAWHVLSGKLAGSTSSQLIITCDENTTKIHIQPNTILEYQWIHSVEKTPIIEVYNVTPNGLILIQAKSQSFGAGHPYSAEEFNGTFHTENGYLVYEIHYNIGKEIEILGNPEFNGTIVLKQDGKATTICKQFTHGVIKVEP